MERRKQLFRTGLLILFAHFVLFSGTYLWAEDGEIIELQIETSPANPIVNSPWSIYVLVKHPNPREVNVEPPRFPSSLALERVRAETRTTSQGDRWTSVEYLFIPLRAGSINLEPFEVRTPGGRALSAAVSVSFREETGRRRYEPRFRWLGGAPAITTGERGVLSLELVNWDPVKRIPQGVFQGKAPTNAILEESSPVEIREGTYRYSINVIPLEGSAVKLEEISFNSDIYALTIPEINIPVRPAIGISTTKPDETTGKTIKENENQQDEIAQNEAEILSFPTDRENVFILFRREYNQIIARAEALWEENRWAETLAEIRRNERDSFSGPFLVPLRKEIEQTLDLGLTENERWRPLKIPFPLLLILGILILSAAVVLRPLRRAQWKNITAFRRRGLVTAIAIIFTAALVFILLEEGLEIFQFGNSGSVGRTAVLKTTQGYRIPDLKGAVSDLFDEGQPVFVGGYTGEWCFAETPDGRSGWVPRWSVVLY